MASKEQAQLAAMAIEAALTAHSYDAALTAEQAFRETAQGKEISETLHQYREGLLTSVECAVRVHAFMQDILLDSEF